MTDKPDRVTERVVERSDLLANLRRYEKWEADEDTARLLGQAADALEALTTRSQPGEDAVERAYKEGWMVNAIPPNEHMAGAGYVHGCCETDWQASEARAALNAAALPVEEWQTIDNAPSEGPLLLWAKDYGPIVAEKRANDGTWWAGDWDYEIKALFWKPIDTPASLEGTRNDRT